MFHIIYFLTSLLCSINEILHIIFTTNRKRRPSYISNLVFKTPYYIHTVKQYEYSLSSSLLPALYVHPTGTCAKPQVGLSNSPGQAPRDFPRLFNSWAFIFIPFIVHPFRGRFYFGYAPLLAAVEALSALGLTPHLVHKWHLWSDLHRQNSWMKTRWLY